ncbi:MAG: zeta toxin family protein [Flavobacteriales bacterium]|nr:MAG: zeta toxin family protein [Flavobacteriales bacterium]
MAKRRPRCIVIAGPNGAGKTTFARQFLPNEADVLHFVNADLIAAGLSPLDPSAVQVRAGRILLSELDRLVSARADFAFETTLSGLSYVGRLRRWKAVGYRLELVFLKLPSAEMAIERVALRVKQGGHHVPAHDIRRRFKRGWHNFGAAYKTLVDSWAVYDNQGRRPVLVDQSNG